MARESYHDYMGRAMREMREKTKDKRHDLLVAHEAMCAKARVLMDKKNKTTQVTKTSLPTFVGLKIWASPPQRRVFLFA